MRERQQPSRTFARAINPNAGLYEITADDAELQACKRAADRSWHLFPYYERRYGAEAWKFGFSDGAWIATLCDRGAAAAVEQVRWLGGVLSSRGMPQIMLEYHLQFLAEELAPLAGKGRDRCAILRPCETELRNARRKQFTDREFKRLSDRFDDAVAPELPQTGTLLVSAVADEGNGIEHAVSVLMSFVRDRSRFSAKWIRAAETVVEEARSRRSRTRTGV